MKCEFVWRGCRTNDTPDERCQSIATTKVIEDGKEINYCDRCAARVIEHLHEWAVSQNEAVVINADGETFTFDTYHDYSQGKELDIIRWHQFCGSLDRNKTSLNRESLHCRNCGLRVLIPAGLKTREDFLKHFASLNK